MHIHVCHCTVQFPLLTAYPLIPVDFSWLTFFLFSAPKAPLVCSQPFIIVLLCVVQYHSDYDSYSKMHPPRPLISLSKPPSPPPSCRPARRLPWCHPEKIARYKTRWAPSFPHLGQLDLTPWCVVEPTSLTIARISNHRYTFHQEHKDARFLGLHSTLVVFICQNLGLFHLHMNNVNMMHAHRAVLAYHLQDCSGSLRHLDLHGHARERVSLQSFLRNQGLGMLKFQWL